MRLVRSAQTRTSAAESAPSWRSHEEAVNAAETGVAGSAPPWPAGPRTRGPRGDGVLNPAAAPRGCPVGDDGRGPGGEL